MKRFVLNSSREGQATDKIPVTEFMLSEETKNQPSFFEIVFLLEDKKYRYSFEIDQKRVISECLYHDDTISHILFDNRKSSLITAGKDKKIKIWKIDPSTLIKVDIDTRESINIASSSSNKYIAMDYEGRLEIRNKEDRLLTIIPPSQFVLQFSPDENILTENTGKFVTLVNFSKTGKTETILDDRKVNDIHLNKGKNNVVSISNDRKVIKVWDYNGKLLNKLNVEDTLIKDFFVSPNGEIIAIINKNNKILLWNLKNNWKKTLNGHTEVTNIIAFSSDSQFFASTGDDSFIKLWKSNGELIKIIKNHGSG